MISLLNTINNGDIRNMKEFAKITDIYQLELLEVDCFVEDCCNKIKRAATEFNFELSNAGMESFRLILAEQCNVHNEVASDRFFQLKNFMKGR